MSQKVSRKTAVNEEKEKRQTHSPVKEMKKKMAANAEKEKQAAEKAADKPTEKSTDKTEKATEKATEKVEKNDKPEKNADKKSEKAEKADKKAEKHNKEEQKKSEPQPEKSKAETSKEDKNGKPEKSEPKKPEPTKTKQNGRDRVHNGVSDVTLGTNGTDDALNGTVSADSEDDDVMLVIDDNDQDDLFPELTYEETSDGDCFELPTPENGPSRSLTRRSQVKSTRTPETPRPASDKQPDKDADDPKDKILKLKDDVPTTDRKLRSSNSPKPQEGKKSDSSKKDKLLDSPKKAQEGLEKLDEKEEDAAKTEEKAQDGGDVEVTLEVPGNEGEEPRKTDTNYSKSRVKVSPYRRSVRLADQTNTSLQANYTGNNTTMEMDITESSSFMEESGLDDSSYLRGLRSIRARASYKPLKELTLKHVSANRSLRSNATTTVSPAVAEWHSRPTGTVVGRKRKPEADEGVETGVEAVEAAPHAPTKRMRVLDRLAEPFRRVAAAAALPTVARRNAEIVGINTDLPLTAPVASSDTFDPESLKTVSPLPGAPPSPSPSPAAVPLAHDERDNKRCVLM